MSQKLGERDAFWDAVNQCVFERLLEGETLFFLSSEGRRPASTRAISHDVRLHENTVSLPFLSMVLKTRLNHTVAQENVPTVANLLECQIR